ncbi:hypothetical protein M413DRAFT_31192 [Hebeloma cylindrosporum]|uniref:Uncharacterized protein n=1 Tax=Hebeloma cylindrosporum TaxID=76867 RepID=A0A0C3BYA6_HEBCY|nr:hypothetical protein M413DRAFT_31192 [Hebeloma cylindrosporum h7]
MSSTSNSNSSVTDTQAGVSAVEVILSPEILEWDLTEPLPTEDFIVEAANFGEEIEVEVEHRLSRLSAVINVGQLQYLFFLIIHPSSSHHPRFYHPASPRSSTSANSLSFLITRHPSIIIQPSPFSSSPTSSLFIITSIHLVHHRQNPHQQPQPSFNNLNTLRTT